MKILHLFLACVGIIKIQSQVGVNTAIPQATFQVAGKPDDVIIRDGIIPPKITGAQLRAKNTAYNQEQDGTILYVTEADPQAATKTKYVTSPGYYYYDAPNSIWIKMAKDHEVAHNKIIFGDAPSAGVNALNWGNQYYTGGSIDIPAGKWVINLGSYLAMGNVSNGNWTAYSTSEVINVNGSAWCACSLSSTSNLYTALNSSTGLVDGSGKGGAGSISQGERSAVSNAIVLIDTNQPRTYYLFVNCNNYGASLGTDRVGNIFGPAWERWFFATSF